ncbi:MAG: SHOCT domain-containing protein [Clostridia bacterium]|nr:SHOCT domain-containing protein [Clostridia bacterium]
MKTACKVFIILSIVSGFILCLFASILLIPMFIDPEMTVPLLIMFIAYGAFGGLAVGFGFKALKLVNNAKRADDISLGWKVVILLLVNQIAGIILLCMKDTDFDPQLAQPQPQQLPNADLERIANLKTLYDNGALSEEEFTQLKHKIIG